MQRTVYSAVDNKTLVDTSMFLRSSSIGTLTHLIINQNINWTLIITVPNI